MISATTFAGMFTSFWKECLPRSRDFVTAANRSSKVFSPRVNNRVTPGFHGDVSEIAFRLFTASLTDELILSNQRRMTSKVREICGPRLVALGHFGRSGRKGLTVVGKEIFDEAFEIATRLTAFMKRKRTERLIVSPRFAGCGFIDNAEGDVLAGRTLYEIKSADQKFRSVDFRQLLVYLALNHAARSHVINRIGLLNPRIGDYIEFDVPQLTSLISGMPPTELFAEIINFVSGGSISR